MPSLVALGLASLDELKTLTVAKLKALLDKCKLKKTGKRAELIEVTDPLGVAGGAVRAERTEGGNWEGEAGKRGGERESKQASSEYSLPSPSLPTIDLMLFSPWTRSLCCAAASRRPPGARAGFAAGVCSSAAAGGGIGSVADPVPGHAHA